MRNTEHAERYLFYFPELGLKSVRENKCETFFVARVAGAVCLTPVVLFLFLTAPSRQDCVRKCVATNRSKLTSFQRSALPRIARMLTPTYVLWDETRIAHGDCVGRACATSRSKVM